MTKKQNSKDKDNNALMNFDSKALAKHIKKAEDKTVSHAHKFIVRRWTSIGEARRHIIGWLLLIGFLIAMGGVQLMWYQNSYTANVPARDTVYVEGALGPVETINPLFASTSAEQSLVKLIFSQPLWYDTDGELGYDLLSNLDIDESETIYTLTIRKDAKWHDGRPVTADDFIYTINTMKDPAVKYASAGVWSKVDAQKIDNHTLELKLTAPFAPFRHYLTFSVLPAHVLKGVSVTSLRESTFSKNPIGSGPFKFNLIQDGESTGSDKQIVHLVRNQYHHSGSPRVARLQMAAYSAQDTLLGALSDGEVHALADLLPGQLPKVDESRYYVRSVPTKGGVYLLFNNTSDVFNSLKMRQAVQNSIDTESLRKKVGGDSLQELYTPIIMSDKEFIKPNYDVEAAKKELTSTGWARSGNGTWKKDGEELRLRLAVIKGVELESVADEVVKQLDVIGIKTDTQILDLDDTDKGVVQNVLQPREFDMLINRINIGADQDVYAYWHSSQTSQNGLNFSNYKNDIADDALTSARRKNNDELRQAKYKTFVKRWLEDVPAVGLYQTNANYVTRKGIRSFGDDVKFISSTSRYADVLYWSSGQTTVYKTP